MYEVSALIFDPATGTNSERVTLQDRHPDLAKQRLERLHPNKRLTSITITDISKPRKSWMKKETEINMEKTWQKNLSR